MIHQDEKLVKKAGRFYKRERGLLKESFVLKKFRLLRLLENLNAAVWDFD